MCNIVWYLLIFLVYIILLKLIINKLLDRVSLKLEKYNFNDHSEQKSVILFDSGDKRTTETGDIIDFISNSYARTYTCTASHYMTKKLITKTKFLLSKSGESLLLRYLYTDQCDLPVRIFEFDNDHYQDILYQVNTSNFFFNKKYNLFLKL
jgi:hypothetical protein